MLKLEIDKKEIEQVIDRIVRKTMNMDLTWDWPCGVAYYGIVAVNNGITGFCQRYLSFVVFDNILRKVLRNVLR